MILRLQIHHLCQRVKAEYWVLWDDLNSREVPFLKVNSFHAKIPSFQLLDSKILELISCKLNIRSEIAVTRALIWRIICEDWWSWRIFHSWLWPLGKKSCNFFDAFSEKFREINLPSYLVYYLIHLSRKYNLRNGQLSISKLHKSLVSDTGNLISSFTKCSQNCCFRSRNLRWSIVWCVKYGFCMISCEILQKTFTRQIFFLFVMIFTQKRTWGC